MAGGQQEPIPFGPVRIVGSVSQLVGVHRGEHVGRTKGLTDVALALRLTHIEGVVAHAIGGFAHLLGTHQATSACGLAVSAAAFSAN